MKKFQAKFGMPVDGLIGAMALNALSGQIIVDLGDLHVYLYRDGKLVRSYPIAAGQPAYPTPTGNFVVVNMQVDPTWVPPDSDWAKDAEPIPPGPDNPLGTRWIGTSSPGWASTARPTTPPSAATPPTAASACTSPMSKTCTRGSSSACRSSSASRRALLRMPRRTHAARRRTRPEPGAALRRNMAEVTPFRGIRYDASIALDEVVAPPYDVIPAAQAAELRGRSPHNAVHLDLPVPPGEAAEDAAYARAAAAFAQWQADGVLVREAAPSLYLVDQSYRGPDGRERTRRGFIARLRLTDFAERVVLPHERTHAGAKLDRLRLYRAAHADLSQIFLLFPDDDGGVVDALEAAASAAPVAAAREAHDGDGNLHRILPLDGSEVEHVLALLRETLPLHRRRPPPLRDGARVSRRTTRRRRPQRRHAHGVPVQHARSGAHRVPHSSPR